MTRVLLLALALVLVAPLAQAATVEAEHGRVAAAQAGDQLVWRGVKATLTVAVASGPDGVAHDHGTSDGFSVFSVNPDAEGAARVDVTSGSARFLAYEGLVRHTRTSDGAVLSAEGTLREPGCDARFFAASDFYRPGEIFLAGTLDVNASGPVRFRLLDTDFETLAQADDRLVVTHEPDRAGFVGVALQVCATRAPAPWTASLRWNEDDPAATPLGPLALVGALAAASMRRRQQVSRGAATRGP